MSVRSAAAVALGVALGWAVSAAHPVAAEEPSPSELRARAEMAFVVGRVADLDFLVGGRATPSDLEPIYVRDGIWRPVADLRPPPADDGSLASRRLRWIVGEYRTGRAPLAAYPLPRASETDLYPQITALVLDRARRESIGMAGMPGASPLAGSADPMLQWIEKTYTIPTFSDAPRPDVTDDEREKQRQVVAQLRSVARRNETIAVVAVGGLALATLAVGFVLARRQKPTGRATDP